MKKVIIKRYFQYGKTWEIEYLMADEDQPKAIDSLIALAKILSGFSFEIHSLDYTSDQDKKRSG